ncbi:MAG: nucleoside-diphosphate kinase [Alphaproteobacteria bacterium]|nr:nucleoside-diphosphate kinase [Alphaproteobacteria bacterium]
MTIEFTLSIIKPDAVARNITGKINAMIEEAGLEIVAQKMILLEEDEAADFYEVHSERPFYDSLVSFMSSGAIIVQVLMGENAVAKYREIMGATNPAEANSGTIRKEFGIDIESNSVHGSDSLENAENEVNFFFDEEEIVKYNKDLGGDEE